MAGKQWRHSFFFSFFFLLFYQINTISNCSNKYHQNMTLKFKHFNKDIFFCDTKHLKYIIYFLKCVYISESSRQTYVASTNLISLHMHAADFSKWIVCTRHFRLLDMFMLYITGAWQACFLISCKRSKCQCLLEELCSCIIRRVSLWKPHWPWPSACLLQIITFLQCFPRLFMTLHVWHYFKVNTPLFNTCCSLKPNGFI